jgi:thymidylate synthase (FAD)
MEDTKLTNVPGTSTFLNKSLMPSENVVVCSAVVHDTYDEITTPESRHYKLLEDMIRSGHWGCLDHVAPSFKITCPIFVARQILRASNASFNEMSGRYKIMKPLFYEPKNLYEDVKRKELGETPILISKDEDIILEVYKLACTSSWSAYTVMLERGLRKEQARMVLPLNTFTEFWMTLKLSDWLHFLNLRLDTNSQMETRFIAELVYEMLKEQFPSIMEYWNKYARGPINGFGTIQTP